jgi:predicted alpha/beta hydrolase family esterase
MRTSDADILIVPGWSNSGEDHWQSRWERSLKTARRVDQESWLRPNRDAWVGRIIGAIAKSTRPVVLVAHSLGVAAVAHAGTRMPKGLVAGAFLVAPADIENADLWPETQGETFDIEASGFSPLPLGQLPFPAALIASTNDPYCSIERARQFAEAWGATLVEGGELGHINADSGHGPWPEGVLRFGGFLSQLG